MAHDNTIVTIWTPPPRKNEKFRGMSASELRKRARARAKQQEPLDGPSEVEEGLFKAGFDYSNKLIGFYEREKDSCLQSISGSSKKPTDCEDYLKSRRSDLDTALRGVIESSERGLTEASALHIKRVVNLRGFKEKNGLEARDARYPDTKFLPLMIVVLLFIIESAINGYAFRDVGDGLVGGAAYAGFFSFVNILLGIGQGLSWRLLIHKNFLLKIIGVILWAATLPASLLWNLFVAHFREMASSLAISEVGNTTVNIVKQVRTDPFGLSDPMSIALLVFGIFIFFIISKDFFSGFSDPYLGYAIHDREVKNAWSDREDELESAREELEEIIYDEKEDIEKKIEMDEMGINGITAARDSLAARRSEIINSIFLGEAEIDQELRIYRDTYQAVRGHRPEHFSDSYNIVKIDRADSSKTKLEELLPIEDVNRLVENFKTIVEGNAKNFLNFENELNDKLKGYKAKLNDKAETIYSGAETRFNMSGLDRTAGASSDIGGMEPV